MRLRFARRGLARVTLLFWCSAALLGSLACVRPLTTLPSGGVAGQLRVLHASSGERDLGAAVVYLEDGPLRAQGLARQTARLLFTEGGSIEPSLLAVEVGQPIRLEVQGGLLHQPFTYSLAGNQDAPTGTSGDLSLEDDARELTLERPGTVRIYCSLHRHERAVIFVSPSPYFSVIDSKGWYGIENVPAGAYRLVLWSEVVEGTVRPIRVEDGSELDANVWIDARKIPR